MLRLRSHNAGGFGIDAICLRRWTLFFFHSRSILALPACSSFFKAMPLPEAKGALMLIKTNGEPGRIRTFDPLIKSQLLYHLSYGPIRNVLLQFLCNLCKSLISPKAKPCVNWLRYARQCAAALESTPSANADGRLFFSHAPFQIVACTIKPFPLY